MRSQGTKETQGINGDATQLQRMLDIAAKLTDGPGVVCPYEHHRGSDWQLTGDHPVRCGVCHPPARGLEVSRV